MRTRRRISTNNRMLSLCKVYNLFTQAFFFYDGKDENQIAIIRGVQTRETVNDVL